MLSESSGSKRAPQKFNLAFKNTLNNQIGMSNYLTRKNKKDCKYYLSKLDYEILRPLLIYKYNKEEMHRQDEFVDMMKNDANLVGSVYGKLDHSNVIR